VKVNVDRGKCAVHGQCAYAAPEVFGIDEDGELAYQAEPGPGQREAVEEATDVCPMQAITVEDWPRGRRASADGPGGDLLGEPVHQGAGPAG
jgi:ferredoxin